MIPVASDLLFASLFSAVAASLLRLSPPVISAPTPLLEVLPTPSSFTLRDNIVGHEFYHRFHWETHDDPTHGRVNYVDLPTAKARNLTSATENSFIMRADDTNIVSENARGRDSNRIASHETYTDSILVADVKHVPWGKTTWPAFWTVAQNDWPNGGEIDIIEGVNEKRANQATLHTSPGCQMDQNREQSGTTISTDCNAYSNGNQGCGTAFRKPDTYGPELNKNGGGYFVMKRTQTDGVYVWFFGRNNPSTPPDVKSGDHINPDHRWGTPDARFPSTDKCDFASHFCAHQIIFDLTFCGDWAGEDFSTSGSFGKCEDFVDNKPQEFKEAYWEINALRIYEPS